MARRQRALLLILACLLSVKAGPRAASDDFLTGVSTIVTREARKQLRDKPIPFSVGPMKGELKAADPQRYLQVEVTSFELANDVVHATATLKGRFQADAAVDGQTNVSALFDVKCEVIAEVRFVKEQDKFFIEPTVKDLDLGLSVLEISRSDLQGGEEFFANLAMAAVKRNKEHVISEINKRIGKRPF